MTVQSRPTGITILAILAAIGGILALLAGLFATVLGGALGAATGSAAVGGLVVLLGVIAVVYGVLSIAFAYGAWTLKPWAWNLGMASQLVGIGLSVVYIVTGNSSISSQILSIVISGLIIYYLNTPAVKAAFGRP
jgi:uncharacterized membrane protein (DUF2068 family)